PEKGVDNPERVNETVSENAGPQAATGNHVSWSEDQSRNAGIDHTRGAFVIVPVSRQDRTEHYPNPISRCQSPPKITSTCQEISAVRRLFGKSGKRPHQQQSK